MITNDLLLRAARRERTERTPVWLMRQAGRTDPAYVTLRERNRLQLESVFRDPDLCAEISLLPERLGVDAIIFFQDILTPLAPMGAPFVFRPGPVLETPIRTAADIASLRPYDPSAELGFVSKTLQLVRTALRDERTGNGKDSFHPRRLPVLGFAGAPLTLAFFLIEGRSPGRELKCVQSLMREERAVLHGLLDKLADMTAEYLRLQIEAGADAVQLFESIADLLTPAEYEEFAHPYHVKVLTELAGRVPTILFAKEQPLVERMAASGADVLSVGACVDLADATRCLGEKVAFQGNVDTRVLADGSFDQIDDAVRHCVRAGGHCGHILNLSHGLLERTPLENVRRFIQTAKATRVESQAESGSGHVSTGRTVGVS
jgi:uroporphyrinogen decarboxylase